MRDYENYDEDYDYFEEEKTYENYSGSYAQDVEGWSDQDIDEVSHGEEHLALPKSKGGLPVLLAYRQLSLVSREK